MTGQIAFAGVDTPAVVDDDLERYYTNPDLAEAIVDRLALDLSGADVLEPHAGGGSFVRALLRVTPHVCACDINPAAPARGAVELDDAWSAQSFLDPLPDRWPEEFDAVVGNPPFSTWEAHARRALEVVVPGGLVCFILPVAVVQLGKHQPFLDEHPIVHELRILGRPWTVVRECSAFMWRRRRPDSRVIDTDWRCERLGWRR